MTKLGLEDQFTSKIQVKQYYCMKEEENKTPKTKQIPDAKTMPQNTAFCYAEVSNVRSIISETTISLTCTSSSPSCACVESPLPLCS